MVWNSPLFKNFPQFVVIYKVRGFSVVSDGEVDVFLEPSHFFYDPTDVGSLISGSGFSKSAVHLECFSSQTAETFTSLKDFEHNLVNM